MLFFSSKWWNTLAVSGILPSFAAQFATVEGGRYMAGGVPKTFAGAIDFTRSSDGTFFDAATILQTAITDVARFDHDSATGARRGLLAEMERAKIALHSDDLTNAVWNTVTNMTPLKNQTGADEVSNSASSLLATSGNAVITQAITSASATRVFSALVKRLVGTGTIEMTQDGGSIWADVTSEINSSTYTQVATAAATVTNPVVGFRIVTNTDKIAVQYCNSEVGATATSPITVAGSPVTRKADIVETATSGTLPFPGYNTVENTIVIEATSTDLGGGSQTLLQIDIGDWNEHIKIFINSGNIIVVVATNAGGEQATVNIAGGLTAGVPFKIAYSYIVGSLRVSLNGATEVTDTLGVMPVVRKGWIGSKDAASSFSKQLFLNSIVQYPVAFSGATLEGMSA